MDNDSEWFKGSWMVDLNSQNHWFIVYSRETPGKFALMGVYSWEHHHFFLWDT